MKIEAVVPAAGLGSRLKSKISKPLIKIGNSTILIRTLKILNRHREINKIIVLLNKNDLQKAKRLVTINRINKVKCVAKGGPTRKSSVQRGLKFLDEDTDFVLIHDGVRPFISKEIISRAILEAKRCGASVIGVPINATIKGVRSSKIGTKNGREFFVDRTLDRSHIWEIQTPQVFRKELIVKAHRKFKNTDATDDAYLVEKLGKKISVVGGSYFNIKITTGEDLIFARAIVRL